VEKRVTRPTNQRCSAGEWQGTECESFPPESRTERMLLRESSRLFVTADSTKNLEVVGAFRNASYGAVTWQIRQVSLTKTRWRLTRRELLACAERLFSAERAKARPAQRFVRLRSGTCRSRPTFSGTFVVKAPHTPAILPFECHPSRSRRTPRDGPGARSVRFRSRVNATVGLGSEKKESETSTLLCSNRREEIRKLTEPRYWH